MFRRKRCADCGTSFYSSHDDLIKVCQACTGSTPDRIEQATVEAKNIEKANTPPKDKVQIVNPRTGKSTKDAPQAVEFPK